MNILFYANIHKMKRCNYVEKIYILCLKLLYKSIGSCNIFAYYIKRTITMSDKPVQYTEDQIKSLDWKEHIRLRPGMYIGKLGDGSAADDGIYVLIKEIVDNSIDEHMMGNGNRIEVSFNGNSVTVRDFGRGIPLGKVVDCVSKINTGGKYDSGAFQKSVGLNGVGTKAVNALSRSFVVHSFRDGKVKKAVFERGELIEDCPIQDSNQKNGTLIIFEPDNAIFKNFRYIPHFLEEQIWNYCFLNAGLTINFNNQIFHSKRGLLDLLERKTDVDTLRYPIMHFKGRDIEIALSHGNQYGEEYYSFVNGQNTTQGGTHLTAFKEAVVKTVRDFYKKDFDSNDIKSAIIGAVAVRVQEPVFESQTKTKLGSSDIGPEGPSIRVFVNDFLKKELDDFLHKNTKVADALLSRIQQSERERKDMAGIRKLANQRAKKANLHNKKLRDCRIHFTNENKDERFESTLFITEGDSASGSITKSRNVESQAVFSLRGKPLNCFSLSKKVVYENEEFNLLQHALGIEEGIEHLRYNKIVIATDADVDGMHIRLLMMTFFLQFFPDLVRNGHVYILSTPLFRVRNKKETIYSYDEVEKQLAIKKLGGKPEITRFKGLGEISPDEFGTFIGEDMRLEPIILKKETSIDKLLRYYMGKNTPDRQDFIIENLRSEKDDLVDFIDKGKDTDNEDVAA
jgi:topoisomerase IV subunit B